jgi:gas vesicle protein
MDDMFSSFDEIYTDPKVVKNLIETVVLESESEELDITDNMVQLLNNIKKSITTQIGNLNEDLYEGITGEEMIELAVKEHQENLSYIDDAIDEKLASSSN